MKKSLLSSGTLALAVATAACVREESCAVCSQNAPPNVVDETGKTIDHDVTKFNERIQGQLKQLNENVQGQCSKKCKDVNIRAICGATILAITVTCKPYLDKLDESNTGTPSLTETEIKLFLYDVEYVRRTNLVGMVLRKGSCTLTTMGFDCGESPKAPRPSGPTKYL